MIHKFSLTHGAFFPESINYKSYPGDAIDVTDDEMRAALNIDRAAGESLSVVDGKLVLVAVQPAQLRDMATMRIKSARDAAIAQLITCSALGAPHEYSAKPENIQFLNGLISLGNGGEFTCTDVDGIKERRPHSDAQLLLLALDIEERTSLYFDHYELLLAGLAAIAALPAPTQADFDAIAW